MNLGDETDDGEPPGDGDGDLPGDGDGDGDPPGDGDGDGDGDPACEFPAPEECLRLVECIGAVFPDQQDLIEAEYGEDGSCWCETAEQAAACFATCVEQLETANQQFPTVVECHEFSCTLAQLDPNEPYGPPRNGSCPSWNGSPQLALQNPLGLNGDVCASPCMGISQSCPDHAQTSAAGTCYLSAGNQDYCVSRCWVDPTLFASPQCQCGATCQPHGGFDGEGNLRGACTFL